MSAKTSVHSQIDRDTSAGNFSESIFILRDGLLWQYPVHFCSLSLGSGDAGKRKLGGYCTRRDCCGVNVAVQIDDTNGIQSGGDHGSLMRPRHLAHDCGAQAITTFQFLRLDMITSSIGGTTNCLAWRSTRMKGCPTDGRLLLTARPTVF